MNAFARFSTYLRVLLLAAGGLLLGCKGGAVIVPYSDEPSLYVILGPEGAMPSLGGLHALLLTTGSPIEAEYLTAERFEMWRTSDGARFDWRHRNLTGRAPSRQNASDPGLWDGNYFLPDSASPEGLGARDLRPGERYEIRVEARGRTLRGSVVVPDAFTVRIVEQGGRRLMVWPRVPGAAGYSVYSGYDAPRVQTDTFKVLAETDPRARGADGDHIRVKALDPNLYTYMTDWKVGRAGISDGYGVFGAVVEFEQRR